MSELDGILRAYKAVAQAGRVAALASVVNIQGSGYRRVGAHMLVTDEGEVVGSVSGGCLERDVCRHAMWVMQSGEAKHLVYDSTGDDDDHAEGTFGLGCNGVVEVLVERLLPGDAYMAFLADCMDTTQSAVAATVFESETNAASTGSRLLWRPGEAPVTLGIDNPVWVAALAQTASDALASGISSARTLETDRGRAAVCFEVIEPGPCLAIFGGGRDAAPVAALAVALGMKVIVVDPRPGHATRIRFPAASQLVVAEARIAVESLGLDPVSAAVVMSHNYQQDLAALRALLPTPVRYLGVLGPSARTRRLLADLALGGCVATEEQLSRLYGPVGLDLGAETADEVALAIVSELKAVLAGRRGGFSRERPGSLHERADPPSSRAAVAPEQLVPENLLEPAS
jgi:xanthine dehydrogenase accessory factor